MRIWLTLAILLMTALAGCSDTPAAPASDDPFAGLDGDLVATEETGIIRGVVVDATITPIEGATVTVVGQETSQQSNADGAFGFSDLAPGFYKVRVEMVGFVATETQTEVVAAVDAPPVVRVVLEADPSSVPYADGYVWSGYFTCSSAAANLCAMADIGLGVVGQGDVLADDTNTVVEIDAAPQWYQAELVWTPTQLLANQLDFYLETVQQGDEVGGTHIRSSSGPSPLLHTVNETEAADLALGVDTNVFHRVFPATSAESLVFIQQGFTIYSHEFYNYAPPEGWRFTDDNQVPDATA